ncbi:TPA: GpE family phage tail protein [Haemophilus influenzae]
MIAATVEDAMADIAIIFHWQPQAFEQMTFSELMQWREKAKNEMKQKLIDYLSNLPRYLVWRGIITLSIVFWLLVVFGIAFLFC